ncbi:uncharacterized protein PG986_008142 [Apiospora aurea]|uniref:C6 zinc finger protein n=1 Tax=Apiospora aurea TaxID=335848 RepID=A0ABR1QEK8_9PEZI
MAFFATSRTQTLQSLWSCQTRLLPRLLPLILLPWAFRPFFPSLGTPSPIFTAAASPSFPDIPISIPTSSRHTSPSLHPRPMALYRNPDPPPISPASQNNRMMELRLLHNYTTITSKTLSLANPDIEAVWRDTVPHLAFSGASFLADGLLAVSALHLRLKSPNDRELIRASHSYMAASLSEYSAALSKGINQSNAEALFLTAALIAFQSTASRIFTRDDGGDVRERSDGYVLPISWFHAFQGVKTIVATSWQWLRTSGIVIPIIQSQPSLNLNLSATKSTFFGHLLDGLDQELDTLEPDVHSRTLTRQAYQHAVAVLNWAHKVPRTGAPMVFLATVSKRYVELLQAKRPRALVILATFFGLLKVLDSGVWWLKGVARREVMGIVSFFDPDDEEWWPRLQWPVMVALHEGETIPPEIWGADLDEETPSDPNRGSEQVLSHIEVLTRMFNSIDPSPNGEATSSDDDTAQALLAFVERAVASPNQAHQTMLMDLLDLPVPQVD